MKFHFSFIVFLSVLGAGYAQPRANQFFSEREIIAANTAKDVGYLSDEEKDIFLYTNLARKYPQKFHSLFVAFAQYEGKESAIRNNNYYKSLSKELRQMEPVQTIYPDRPMFELASCWADESGRLGLVGHERKTCVKGYDGENCAYGYETGLEIVMQLLIDEGVPGYGHRVNMLYPDWKGMGAAIRPHKNYRFTGVQNFARTNDEQRVVEEQKSQAEERKRLARKAMQTRRMQEFEEVMGQWDELEMKTADVARSLNYLNDLEKDLYFYTNLMRLYPKKFKTLIWDQGPFFNQSLDELENGIQREASYLTVANWLNRNGGQAAFIPAEKHIRVLRCVIQTYLAKKEDYRKCFEFAGSWRYQTYYSASNFEDVMNILLTAKDFNDLINNRATLAIHQGNPSVKVFVTPSN